MSVVTDVWIIVGDVEYPRESAEARVEKIAQVVQGFLGISWPLPTISLIRDDWQTLQNGTKVAGSAAIWFGYNYADMPKLEACLKGAGFTHVTIWSHHENHADQPPRVVQL